MPLKKSRFFGLLLATLAAVCWGLATVMSKGALSSFPPVLLLIVQLLGSGLFLWVIAGVRRVEARSILQAVELCWLGLLEPGAAYLLALSGMVDTLASGASLIGASEAIMIAALSAIIFRERLSVTFILLSIVAFGGLIVALGIAEVGVRVGDWQGMALIFLGTLAAALYVVLSGRFLGDRDPMLVLAFQQIVAFVLAVSMLPLLGNRPVAIAAVTSKVWALALISGTLQYAISFWLYLVAMRQLRPSVAGSILNLIPVVGLAAAYLFLDEKLSMAQLAGAAVTVIALILVSLLEE
jgi:drug/metabolite transporter (DMT)-like permease